MSDPEISVVIPSHRREARLAFALDALAVQTIPRTRYEVLVVRPAGGDTPLTGAPGDLQVRFIEAPAVNASDQRNHGWRAAKAPLIAFTDDDCRPAPDWLQRLLEASNGPDVVVQGRTEPDPDERHLLFATALSQRIVEPSDWYETCNIAYPRQLLERVGGFDEDFAFGGEDTDLGLRAIASGARRIYDPEALVHHAVHSRPLHRALADPKPAPTTALLFARHRSQRSALYLGVFWNRSHARLLLALLGVAILGRRPRALLAFAPYLMLQLNHALDGPPLTSRGSVKLAVELAERLAIDLAELTANARRSVRYRTLVL